MADLIVNKNGSITTNKKKKKQTDLFVSSNGTIYVDKNEQKKYISNGNGNGGSFSPIKSPTTKKSKENKGFLDNLGYIGKNLGAGAVGGLTGLVKSGTTEVKNNLKKSEKEGFFKNALDLFDASQNILNPTKGFAELTKNNIKNIYENVTDKKKTKTQKATDIALSGLTEAANTFVPGKKLADEAVQLYGNAIGSEKAEKVVDKFDKFASKPYEDLSENIRKESDQYGGKTQLAGTVANVVGNMGPSIAATMLTKNPNIGLGVMGVSAKGSATQEALNRGADLEQAIKIGNAKGMIEIGTEMLTGGVNIFGKGALDNIAERGVDKAVKNKVLNYLGKKGVGIGGEVLEETISDVLGTVIDRGTVDPKASYSIDDWEDTALTTVLSTLVLNALTGGYGKRSYMENSAQLEQQSNEKKVVDSLVNEKATEISKQRATENAINEAISTKETEQGGTLSTKEKAAIKQQIEAKIESGEIELSSSKLSKKEISTIKSEVEEQMNKGLLDTNKINSILGENKVSKNSILAKSYEETAKKSQKFIQDTTKITNENEKAVYDSASKYLNNTTRSHEFVENVAKLSKEKGVNYGFINNEELKSLGHDLEGKQVNGLVRTSQDGTSKVLINIDSPKALNTIVGHETTHLLEGTKEYQELQEAIFNYAKEKGDFDSRQKSLNELYDGIENVNIDSEITADLVGDYLFTDENFVKSLSTQKPTVFQKIKNLIDDLVVKFKGTKEEKQLREVQKKFREAYRNTTTQQNETNLTTEANSNTTSDVKYSIIGIKNIDKALNNKNVDENTKNSLNNVKNNYIKALSKEGKESNESIRRETGWFKDRNGDWKFEITDKYSKLKLIPSPNKTYKLGDILDHKLLYDVNPEIKNLKVKFKDLEGKRGQYLNLPVIGSIRINNSLLKKGENEIRSTLLHEIQHYNQHFNKFEKGMSSGETLEDMIKYVNGLGEIEAKNVQERMDLSKAELKSIAPTSSKENPIHPQAEQLIEKRKRQIANKSKKSYNGFRGMFNEEDIEETNGQNRGLSIQTLGNGLEELDNSSFSFGKNDNNTKNSIGEKEPLEKRVSGDALLDAQDLIEEVKSVGANVDENGYVTVYHVTTPENAEKIKTSGKMSAKENGIFFSTSKNAQQGEGRGGATLEFKIPAEKLVLDDLFSDNADVKIPLKNTNEMLDVSNYLINDINNLKNEQYKIIENSNPVEDEYHTWIRSTDDIKTFEETLNDPDWVDYREEGFDPDYTGDIINEALETGKITVYSSYPIEQGIFVTPSQMEAETYSGNGKVYSKEVNLTDVAWIDPTQGQYAKVYNYSLSNQNETSPKNPNLTYGEDVKYQEAISPIQEEISKVTNEVQQMREQINKLVENPYEPSKVGTTEEQTDLYNQNNFDNLENQGIAPIENTTPEQKYENSNEPSMTDTKSLFETRDYAEVGNRKVNAYQYDHPEVKPYFQEAAVGMLSDLDMSTKGERFITGDISQLGNGEYQYTGTTRNTVSDIAELLDGVDGKYKLSYEDIKNGLNAIIEDHGAENTAAAKRLEFYLDKRLRDGYTTIDGTEIEPNQTYIEEMRAKGFDDFYKSIPIDESLAPVENTSNTNKTTNIAPTKQQINEQMIRGKELKVVEEKTTRNINIQQELPLIESQEVQDKKTAKILDEKPVREKEQRLKQIATINLVDKGYYISKLARKTNNRQLDALWDNTLLSQAQAQETIGEGRYKFNAATKSYDKVGESVYEIFEGLENANKVKDFNEYMYHKLNIERMSLDQKGETNKPVFGEDVNAFKSQMIVNELEQNNPEFSDYAKRVYEYESGENSDLSSLVDAGVLSQEQANYYREKYNNYVPIIRDIDTGFLEGQIFGKRTSVKNPIKNAVGGNQNLLPLKDAMAIKTMLVQKSVNMNKLGLELMYTLNPEVTAETVTADQVIDAMASGKDLIKAGADGKAPTMTVYENGVKTTFEIPMDIYEALKVNNDSFTKLTFKPFNSFSNFKRNVLTQYNPFFMVTNAIKDAQDVLINSQHPFKTYKAIPEAIAQLTSKGYWYREMQSQGLFQDTYYDNIKGFDTKPKGLEKIQEFYPLRKISEINDFIERVPRMAEYIASRKEGRSIEVASLDSQRVTTNFKAGGDFTKFLNRNGATFLNASVQGAVQQVRNVQEAHMQGLKGYMKLATKFTVAALPAVILNSLLWGDDDDYEQLNDYIKDNYYVIGKYGDGQFIRIPKGRMIAVIQKGLENMQDLITGDDEVDLGSYLEMVVNNLAPNNPVENNVLSPFLNTKLFNNDDPGKTWYGSDLVPSRLQDKPAAEQYDETTDEFSKWLGGKLNLSPIKINNLIDQNSGVIGDLILPMMTAEAKTKNTNPVMAGIEDKFTADVVFDNKYSSNFYSEKEKLAKKSNSDKATDEDELKTKFLNSIQSNMNDLHKEIREIQNSDLDKETKYAKVRELNKQINEMARVGLNSYEDMTVNDNYASVSNTEYYKHLDNEGKETWSKINDKEKAALESMNMSDSDKNNYFNAKNTISSIVKDYKNDKSTLSDEDEDSYKEAVASLSSEKKASIINTIKNSGLDDEAKAYLYDKYYGSEDKLNVVVSTGIGMDNYLELEAQNFQSDKDRQGKTISGSKKKKVFEYINSTDLDFEKKIILAKMYYSSYNEYNYDIIEYLNNDNSISYEEEEEILKTLGFKVDSNGNVRW